MPGSRGPSARADPLPSHRELGAPAPLGALFFHLQIANKHPRAHAAPHALGTPRAPQQPGKHRGTAGQRALSEPPRLGCCRSGHEGCQGFPQLSQFLAGHTLPGTPAQSPGCCPKGAHKQTLQPLPVTPCASGPSGFWGDGTMPPFPILLLGPAPHPSGGPRGVPGGHLAPLPPSRGVAKGLMPGGQAAGGRKNEIPSRCPAKSGHKYLPACPVGRGETTIALGAC